MSISFTQSLTIQPGSKLIHRDGTTEATVLSEVNHFVENGNNRFSLEIGTGDNPEENKQIIYNDTTDWFVPINPDLLGRYNRAGTHIELSEGKIDFSDMYL